VKALKIGDLNISLPIIQGGMGIGISMSKLASAVANMGGIGVISTVGIGLTSEYQESNTNKSYIKGNIDALRAEIRKARQLTNGVIGVNIMSVITDFSEMVKTSIEEKIDIIFSGAGLPLDLPKYLKEGIKTKLVPIVSSGRAAAILCNKWYQNYNFLPDAFVVEGPKAGGHLGFKANQLDSESNKLEKLVADVLAVTKEMKEKFKKEIPVIAAGGIFSGTDVYKILKQGAAAVQMGTRFVTTEECDASAEFKNAIVQAQEKDVQIIKSPVGMPGRTVFNKFLDEAFKGKRKPKVCKHNCIRSCDPKTTTYCISEALLEAYRGNLKDGFAFVGANANLVKEITTVPKVFAALQEEYNEAARKEAE
jgi:nitronate monooxygenase